MNVHDIIQVLQVRSLVAILGKFQQIQPDIGNPDLFQLDQSWLGASTYIGQLSLQVSWDGKPPTLTINEQLCCVQAIAGPS